MTTERDPQTRLVLSWLREDLHENADRVLADALDEIDTTQQRRSWWPAWRGFRMNKLAMTAATAGLLLVAAIGASLLPRLGILGPGSTPSPSPSPGLLARGDFGIAEGGYVVQIEARGGGSSVTGSMTVSEPLLQPGLDTVFTVDLQCAATTRNGVIMIGGVTTEGDGVSPVGAWAAIVLQPGPRVNARILSQRGGPASRATSCLAYLDEQMPAQGVWTGLVRIVGSLELGTAQ